MGLRFVLGRGGIGKTTFMLNQIKNRVQDNETSPVILLVPEQYSFEMEKKMSKLFLGEEKDKYLRSRVLSFKTMSNIVFSKVGGLTDVNINSSGRAMMIYKSIDKISKDLEVYFKSSTQSGFVGSIADIISELKQYSVSPEMLENIAGEVENETLRYKLKDIAKIYAEFEANLHENYVDSQDMLTSLAAKLEQCEYFKDAYIYIDEFTGFTPNQYNVLKVLLKQAKEVHISLTIDSLTQFTYSKNDAFSRTKYTFEKLYKIAAEEGVKIHTNINLNTEEVKRFKDNEELQHLEKFYHAYPYRKYEKETKYIKIKEFNNLYDEVEQVAKDIIHLAREKNVRYKDITVATRDLNRYNFLVKSIFKEYEIPNFIDEKKEAKSNPIIVLILSALEMKNRRYSYETMFRYLKSGLIGVDAEDISLLENYVLLNGIRGKKWFEEKWTYKVNPNYLSDESDFDLLQKEKINEIKDKVLAPIITLQDKLKKQNKTVKEICQYVYEFLLDIEIEGTLEKLISNFNEKGDLEVAKEYSQVWQIVIDILDQMVELMGDEKISLDKFMKVISLGFDEYELGLVPPSMDQVLVSSIDRMKNTNTKYLYLIGSTDGIFPLISKDNGLLSDKDRKTLGDSGLEVDIDSKTRTYEEQFLVYKALTSTSENLILTYPISDHEGKTLRPSIIISRLKKIFPNINMKTYVLKDLDKSNEDALDKITVKAPTFNELINAIKDFEIRGEINEIWLDIYRYFLSDEEYKKKLEKVVSGLSYTNQVDKVEKDKIKSLYENKNLSVSKLERYAQCPFSYFIQYGLKAQERKEYSFSAPDLGSFIHNILDIFSKNLNKDKLNWHEIDEDYIRRNVSVIVDEMVNKIPGFILNSSERYKYLAYRLKKMLISAISIISTQIKQGNFEPVDYEVSFRKGGKYPPIKMVLNNGEEITLVGQIDRIDELDKGDEKYIRIIDYKSGDKSINLTEVYYGLQLQLLVYLDAIIDSDRYKKHQLKPAAVLYNRIDNPIVRSNEDQKDTVINEEILKKLRMNGLVLKDVDIIGEMDKSLKEGERKTSLVIPANLDKNGNIGRYTKGVTDDEFDLLRDYVKHEVKVLCERMTGGDIGIVPCKNKNGTSCDYCIYSSICQFDPTIKGNQYTILNEKSDEEVLKLMEKEVK
ncbi:MAG: helicase-exonuclease AddAB subunit AddB [Terrisporobacter sp.]|uniref:helicase-exonuclease AddAB subunit AddB n=1 Tax=Terrisporobacter sp. TaxID=1965305 RepID=UPI002FC699D6